MTELPQKILLRPDEVAEYFAVSRQSVYNWLATGKLKHLHTPGGQIRIHRDSVAELEKLIRIYKDL